MPPKPVKEWRDEGSFKPGFNKSSFPPMSPLFLTLSHTQAHTHTCILKFCPPLASHLSLSFCLRVCASLSLLGPQTELPVMYAEVDTNTNQVEYGFLNSFPLPLSLSFIHPFSLTHTYTRSTSSPHNALGSYAITHEVRIHRPSLEPQHD